MPVTTSDSKHTYKEIVFISDLHLCEEREELSREFFSFIERESQNENLDSLYVLGDLFDYWLGDDEKSRFAQDIKKAFHRLSLSGAKVYFMRGNRDFTLGDTFAQQCGGTLLQEYHVINLFGKPTLLLHGDSLCTDDTEYQKYKRLIRHPIVKNTLLKSPRKLRKLLARKIRSKSQSKKTGSYTPAFDVNETTVKNTFDFWSVQQIIHGHTHRPKRHDYAIENTTKSRYVLGDWGNNQQAWALRTCKNGITYETFPLS